MQKPQPASSKPLKIDKVKAEQLCDDFIKDIEGAIELYGDNGISVAIETAYDKHIFNNKAGMTKSFFLRCLNLKTPLLPEIFDAVVDHLFTPMAWSKITLQKYFGIKNVTSGKLVTLMRNESENKGADFLLIECTDQPDLSPMLVRDRDAAEKFIAILNRPATSTATYDSSGTPPPSANSDPSGRMVHLDLDENINTGNLEVVEVEILFR